MYSPASDHATAQASSFGPRTPPLVQPSSAAHRAALQRLFQRLADVTLLPPVAERIFCIVNDLGSDRDELREAIEADPLLPARILRRVNSPHFGLSRKVEDLDSAISLLGVRGIHNIVLTLFVSRLFETAGSYRSYSRAGLWRHSYAVAVTARKIARITNAAAADVAFAAGLLHHVGTIVLDEHLRRQFLQVIDRLDDKTPTYLIEQQAYSFDQAQLGEFVVSEWGFPPELTDAIRSYHAPKAYHGPNAAFVYLLQVADYLCSRAGWTSLGVHNVPPPSSEAYAALGLNQVALSIVWEDLREIFGRAETFDLP